MTRIVNLMKYLTSSMKLTSQIGGFREEVLSFHRFVLFLNGSLLHDNCGGCLFPEKRKRKVVLLLRREREAGLFFYIN